MLRPDPCWVPSRALLGRAWGPGPVLLLPCGTSSQSRGAPQDKWHHLGCRRVPAAPSLTGEHPGSHRDGRGGDCGGTLRRGSTVRGLERGLCRQGRGRRRGERWRVQTVTSSCISGLGYQRRNGAGGSKVPGKGQRKPQPVPQAASPRQLGAEAHAEQLKPPKISHRAQLDPKGT